MSRVSTSHSYSVVLRDLMRATNSQEQAQGQVSSGRLGDSLRAFAPQVEQLIAANSVEQKIMDMQKKKGDLAAMMLDGADSGWKALTSDDLVSLFS